MDFVHIFAAVFLSFYLLSSLINLGIRIGFNFVKRVVEPEAQRFGLMSMITGIIGGPFLLGLSIGSALASSGLYIEEPEIET